MIITDPGRDRRQAGKAEKIVRLRQIRTKFGPRHTKYTLFRRDDEVHILQMSQ
jgi:hypothetical protein